MNVLVSAAYRDKEDEITDAFLERFWFDKVEVDNIYRERLGEELNATTEDDLRVNIIYVADGQSYFTFNEEIAAAEGHLITDPIVMIFTGNIHPVQTLAVLSRGILVYSDTRGAQEIQDAAGALAAEHGAEGIVQGVRALSDA